MKSSKECVKCNESFCYSSEECKWDYKGLQPVKIVECPNCGCVQAVRYEKIKNINTDKRFF